MNKILHGLQLNKLTRAELILLIAVSAEPAVYVPQVYKIYATRSAEDFVIVTWTIGVIANIAWTIYGIKIKKAPVIISSVVWMIINLLIVIGTILYG